MSDRETPARPRTARTLAGVIRARGQAGTDAELRQDASAQLERTPSESAASVAGDAFGDASFGALAAGRPGGLPRFPVTSTAQIGGVQGGGVQEAASTGGVEARSPAALPLFTTQDLRGAGGGVAFDASALPGAPGPRLVTRPEGWGTPVPGTSWPATTGAGGAASSGGPAGSATPAPGQRPGQVGSPFGVQPDAQVNARRRNQLADHELVRVLQRGIGERLAARSVGLGRLSVLDEEMLAQQVATEVVNDYVAEHEAQGQTVFVDPAVRQATIHAAVDRVVKHGLLTQYLERVDVENIDAIGYDHVVLSLADGSIERVGAIASSDEDLIETVAMWASRLGQGEKQLSAATPLLEMALHDGSRLSMIIEVAHRPILSIRRHRLSQVDLQRLVEADMCTEAQASLLAACVRARRNIVVSGAPGSGKTTFLRALAATIDANEMYISIETDFELYLHENSDQLVKAVHARQGSGEYRPDGTRPGEIGVATLMYAALRQNISRMVVGEVRSPQEIRVLTEAMNAAHGTMATVHTRTATAVISRLVNALTSEGYSDAYAQEQVGEHVDVVVHIEAVTRPDGSTWRRVAEILEISEGECKVGRTVLFGRRPGERGVHLRSTHVEPQTAPSFLDELVAVGFDAAWLNQPITDSAGAPPPYEHTGGRW